MPNMGDTRTKLLPSFTISRSLEDPLKLEFNPPRGTDALFDALRQHFPDLGTHQLRLQKAVIEFHTHEIERETHASNVLQEQLHLNVPLVNFLPPVLGMEANISRGPPTGQNSSLSTNFAPTSRDNLSQFHSMLGHFGKFDGPRKGHAKRPMDKKSREEYKIVKREGACAKHRKQKKKCNCLFTGNGDSPKKIKTPSISTRLPPESIRSFRSSPDTCSTTDEISNASIGSSPRPLDALASINTVGKLELAGSDQAVSACSDFSAFPVFTDTDMFSPFLLDTPCASRTPTYFEFDFPVENGIPSGDSQFSSSLYSTNNTWPAAILDNLPKLSSPRLLDGRHVSLGGLTGDLDYFSWSPNFDLLPQKLLYCAPGDTLLPPSIDTRNNPRCNSHIHPDHGLGALEAMLCSDWDNASDQWRDKIPRHKNLPTFAPDISTAPHSSSLEILVDDRSCDLQPTSKCVKDRSELGTARDCIHVPGNQSATPLPHSDTAASVQHVNVWDNKDVSIGFNSNLLPKDDAIRTLSLQQPNSRRLGRRCRAANVLLLDRAHGHHGDESCGHRPHSQRKLRDSHQQTTSNKDGWDRSLLSGCAFDKRTFTLWGHICFIMVIVACAVCILCFTSLALSPTPKEFKDPALNQNHALSPPGRTNIDVLILNRPLLNSGLLATSNPVNSASTHKNGTHYDIAFHPRPSASSRKELLLDLPSETVWLSVSSTSSHSPSNDKAFQVPSCAWQNSLADDNLMTLSHHTRAPGEAIITNTVLQVYIFVICSTVFVISAFAKITSATRIQCYGRSMNNLLGLLQIAILIAMITIGLMAGIANKCRLTSWQNPLRRLNPLGPIFYLESTYLEYAFVGFVAHGGTFALCIFFMGAQCLIGIGRHLAMTSILSKLDLTKLIWKPILILGRHLSFQTRNRARNSAEAEHSVHARNICMNGCSPRFGTFTVMALISNRTIGSGIFSAPVISILLWTCGAIFIFCACRVWLEFGLDIPNLVSHANGPSCPDNNSYHNVLARRHRFGGLYPYELQLWGVEVRKRNCVTTKACRLFLRLASDIMLSIVISLAIPFVISSESFNCRSLLTSCIFGTWILSGLAIEFTRLRLASETKNSKWMWYSATLTKFVFACSRFAFFMMLTMRQCAIYRYCKQAVLDTILFHQNLLITSNVIAAVEVFSDTSSPTSVNFSLISFHFRLQAAAHWHFFASCLFCSWRRQRSAFSLPIPFGIDWLQRKSGFRSMPFSSSSSYFSRLLWFRYFISSPCQGRLNPLCLDRKKFMRLS